jgi:hypothetical protein
LPSVAAWGSPRATDEISFANLTRSQARALELPAGHPGVAVTRQAYDLAGVASSCGVTRGDAFAFHYTVTITEETFDELACRRAAVPRCLAASATLVGLRRAARRYRRRQDDHAGRVVPAGGGADAMAG